MKSRAASIYILFTSIVLFISLGYLGVILHQGRITAKTELSELRRQLENAEIKIYDEKGRLDPLVIENIYRYNQTIDYITLYRQKNIIATGGSEPAMSIDESGKRQYQHYWWQKIVRTYFPDPLHDQDYSVDIIADIIPQSVLKNALLTCILMLSALLGATLLYSAAYYKAQAKKKQEDEQKAAQKEMQNSLVADTQSIEEKPPVSMDVPIETILGPQVVEEFFSGLDLLDEQESQKDKSQPEKPKENVASFMPEEDEDAGFFDTLDIPQDATVDEQSAAVDEIDKLSEEDSSLPEISELEISDLSDLSNLPEIAEPQEEEQKTEENLSDIPDLPDLPEISEEEILDDLSKELLPEVIQAAEISEILEPQADETKEENIPDIEETESAEDVNNEAQDIPELENLPDLPDLPELTEDTIQPENIEQEQEIEQEIQPSASGLDEEIPDLPDLPDLPEISELQEEQNQHAEDILEHPDQEKTQAEDEQLADLPDLDDLLEISEEENFSNLPDLPELSEEQAENETQEIEENLNEEPAEESFPELIEPLNEEEEAEQEEQENQQEEAEQEIPVLDDEEQSPQEESQENAYEQEEDEEDLIPLEDLEQISAHKDQEDDLDDLPQMEDLLGPNSPAREDDADDIDDLPDLDNLLMAEEMQEKGIVEKPLQPAIELSENMLEELTSTPDVGLKNLSSDTSDDDLDTVLADIEAENDETYLPSFETNSRFPEPPLLKGMISAAQKVVVRAKPPQKPLHVPVLLEPEKEELPKGVFACTAAELEEAVKKTDWKESLSSILLDAEEMEEDFSLLIFALADEEAGRSVMNKYFTQEHGLTLHRFSDHSFGIWLINTNLEGAYGIAGEFVYFMEEQRLVTAVGLSAKSDRLVRSEHLSKEATHALSRAISSGGGIVGFRSDPRKYARVTVGR